MVAGSTEAALCTLPFASTLKSVVTDRSSCGRATCVFELDRNTAASPDGKATTPSDSALKPFGPTPACTGSLARYFSAPSRV